MFPNFYCFCGGLPSCGGPGQLPSLLSLKSGPGPLRSHSTHMLHVPSGIWAHLPHCCVPFSVHFAEARRLSYPKAALWPHKYAAGTFRRRVN